jgi:hypothetical protein
MLGFHELYERHAGEVYRFEWIFRDKPIIAITFALTGLACWVAAFVINWRAHRLS